MTNKQTSFKMIHNEQKFKQSILFEGLNNDTSSKKTGTDIDYEYECSKGKIWIRAEVKEHGKEFTKGQQILHYNFIRNLINYKVYIFLLWHNTPPNEDILIKNCEVARYYWEDKRGIIYNSTPKEFITFQQAFNKIVN